MQGASLPHYSSQRASTYFIKFAEKRNGPGFPGSKSGSAMGRNASQRETPNPPSFTVWHKTLLAEAKRTTAEFRVVVGKNVITQIDYKSMLSHTDITTTVGANIILPVLK